MKLLVVGCGSIGSRHLANLLALRAGEIVVCEPDEERAARAEALGVRVQRELDAALALRPDAVLVCTPTHLHLPVARCAIQAGARVFIEKPLSSGEQGVAEFVAFAEARRAVVLVACNMRFHPGVSHLKRMLDAGVLGRPLIIRAHFGHYLPNWRPGCDYRSTYSAAADQGGGMLLEGVHEIDYVRWLGGEVRTIAAFGNRVSPLEIDSEDTALIAIELEKGGMAEIHLDCLRHVKGRGCEIVGTLGSARWISEGKNPEVVLVQTCPAGEFDWRTIYQSDAYDANAMYRAELEHFLDCVSGRARPLLDAAGAMRVLDLALACRQMLRPPAASSAERC